MVGGVPPLLALRDALFAAGLGFLLCMGYSAARLALGSSRRVCAVCDALALALGAVAYRSAAVSFLYAGVPRWYTAAACAGAFLLCRAASAPLLERVRAALVRPLAALAAACARPVKRALRACAQKRGEKRRQKQKNRPAHAKKRLQNTQRVLYNSN